MRYQTVDRLAKCKTNYKVLMSGRNTGKSTSMAKYLIDRFEKHNYKFVRLVRNITYTVEAGSYFDRFSMGGEFYEKTKPKRQDRVITFEYYYEADTGIVYTKTQAYSYLCHVLQYRTLHGFR